MWLLTVYFKIAAPVPHETILMDDFSDLEWFLGRYNPDSILKIEIDRPE